jgi:hypothetical protein
MLLFQDQYPIHLYEELSHFTVVYNTIFYSTNADEISTKTDSKSQLHSSEVECWSGRSTITSATRQITPILFTS